MISMRWTKRKKKEFRARIKLIEEYKNKLYYYAQKVKEDGIITIEEVKQFDTLLAEFNNKLLELKLKQTKKNYNMISSMSAQDVFKEMSLPNFRLNEKDIKKINKEIHQELS